MTSRKILQENQSYTFRSYFEMCYEADEILAELGYNLLRRHISLPKSNRCLERLQELKQRIEEYLTLASLSIKLLRSKDTEISEESINELSEAGLNSLY
ncbi:hypothetical protein [Cylindrospermopsis curvispora]|uniref:hypothetical protein n=1 Tax=Cylindrospermopsis curvispora TaxID=747548 RepID=UPI001F3422FB|nr:hypothetical protein [Cylindrospermopsis curvispora]